MDPPAHRLHGHAESQQVTGGVVDERTAVHRRNHLPVGTAAEEIQLEIAVDTGIQDVQHEVLGTLLRIRGLELRHGVALAVTAQATLANDVQKAKRRANSTVNGEDIALLHVELRLTVDMVEPAEHTFAGDADALQGTELAFRKHGILLRGNGSIGSLVRLWTGSHVILGDIRPARHRLHEDLVLVVDGNGLAALHRDDDTQAREGLDGRKGHLAARIAVIGKGNHHALQRLARELALLKVIEDLRGEFPQVQAQFPGQELGNGRVETREGLLMTLLSTERSRRLGTGCGAGRPLCGGLRGALLGAILFLLDSHTLTVIKVMK